MNKNTKKAEKMNFVGKILTDRDLYGNSMSLAKIVNCSKTNKKDKASFIVFQNDIKALASLAFDIFKDRFNAMNDVDKVANMNEFNDDKNKRDTMFKAIDSIISDIGTVGPGGLAGPSLIYNHAVEHCYKYFDVYHGEAMLVKSQLDNAKKTLKNYLDAPNGVNKDAITNASLQVDRLSSKLDELKKKAGSVTLEWRQIGDVAFCADMEKFLCKLAKKQAPMTESEYKDFKKSCREESKANAKKVAKEKIDKKNKTENVDK